jgi:serine/threonine protein kinase/tetratricopeptide (TPR) repeat protein
MDPMECPKCHSENPDTGHYCSSCGSPIPLPKEKSSSQDETRTAHYKELTVGLTFFNRYQVLEELGKGGMGRVYKVLDKEINEKIALKLLNPKIATDQRTIKRFRNELKYARQISHKNVCRLYDFREEEGIHYITMEYVPGEDLKSSIKRIGPLSAGKAIFLAKQLCEGLREAHKLGIVHRDLKPRNIMIDKEGNVRIMDFGIARSLRTEGLTDTGIMIGTPEYMSPEQVEGRETDQRSDLYSVGVVLYEMLTGTVPFQGDTPISIAVKHKTEVPPDPRALNPQIPEELSIVILKCMEKDQEKRYQNVNELLSILNHLEEKYPTTESILPGKSPFSSTIKTPRNIMKSVTLSLIFVAVVIAGIIMWRFVPPAITPPTQSEHSLAILYFENNTGDEGFNHWRKALAELLITDLSQSKYLTVISGDKIFEILQQLNLENTTSYSSKDLNSVANRMNVNHLLRGGFAKAGDNFRVDITIQKAGSGEHLGSDSVEGFGEESFFSMVDELTRRIKGIVNLSSEEIASDTDEAIQKITTSSPEAYKYYTEGRKFQLKGDYPRSIAFMGKAIEIDPEFAMAYRGIAISYGNLGYHSFRMKNLQKALELTDRLPNQERYLVEGDLENLSLESTDHISDLEKYLIEADFYKLSERTYDKAIEAYNKVLELEPNNRSANINLGNLYRAVEQWDKAIQRYKVCIENKDETIYPYTNLADAYEGKGLYDRAVNILERYLISYQIDTMSSAIVHRYLALNYLYQAKYDQALKEVGKAFSLDPDHPYNFRLRGDISQLKGDLIQAEKEYRALLENKEENAQIWARHRLGTLFLLQGKFNDSENQIKQLIELHGKNVVSGYNVYLIYIYFKSGQLQKAFKEADHLFKTALETGDAASQREALLYRGIIQLEMGLLEEAKQSTNRLKEFIQQSINKKEIRTYYHLMGRINLKENHFSKAIGNLEKAISLLPFQNAPEDQHAFYRESLARAYYQSGDFDKAQEEYERIISLTSGRLFYGDIFAKSHYRLGNICQKKGQKEKAIDHFEKFLDLWKEADQNLPEIIDAKSQLASYIE